MQVLHIGRVKRQKETNADDAAWIDGMCQQHRLYVTPYGSNDDWYWMYAAVAAGSQGRLISNDEMRDHVFQLLAPRYFYKWKQRHQARAPSTCRMQGRPAGRGAGPAHESAGGAELAQHLRPSVARPASWLAG